MRRSLLYYILLLMLAPVATAQVRSGGLPSDPPPLPPEPLRLPPDEGPPVTTPGSASDKYQRCLQRMIDTSASDPDFMRLCLGKGPARPKYTKPVERLSVTSGEVAAVINGKLPELQRCYDSLLQQTQSLGLVPEGAVEPRFVIKNDGGMDSLTFGASSPADAKFLGCVRSKMLAWRFAPRPSPNSEATRAHLILQFQTLSTPGTKKPKTSVKIAPGYPKLSGEDSAYTPEELLAVFKKNAPQVRGCYNELAKRRPDAVVQVTVEVIVSAKGRVNQVTFKDDTSRDAPFKACLDATLRKWRYPEPRSKDIVTVKFPPFMFSPVR